MSKIENSYRNILKGTSVFGSVQVFNILIAAVRVKFVALILGPAGMGVAALFTSASTTLQQMASLGLNLSVVKEIGAAKDSEERLTHILRALRPMIWGVSFLGASVCFLFPALLSRFTFGSHDFSWQFALLGIALFFSIFGVGLMSVLQGLHEVKRLSRASVIGSTVGLLVGVPLYWLLGTDGIVPAMCVLAFCTFLWYLRSFRKAVGEIKTPFSKAIHIPLMKKMLWMGLILMSNDLMRNLVNFAISVFVRSEGGMADVGLYQSCNTMTAQYSAIVFTAMAMDYLPRLSATARDNKEMCIVVNRQLETVVLLIAPVVCAVILFAPTVIKVLQTEAFLSATTLLRLLAVAVVVKGIMYPLGYITFAKDNKKVFFWMETVVANIMTLLLTCGGFHLFGLNGLGYAAVADCLLCLAMYVGVNHYLYGYIPGPKAILGSIYALASTGCVLVCCLLLESLAMWCAGSLIVVVSAAISFGAIKKLIRK